MPCAPRRMPTCWRPAPSPTSCTPRPSSRAAEPRSCMRLGLGCGTRSKTLTQRVSWCVKTCRSPTASRVDQLCSAPHGRRKLRRSPLISASGRSSWWPSTNKLRPGSPRRWPGFETLFQRARLRGRRRGNQGCTRSTGTGNKTRHRPIRGLILHGRGCRRPRVSKRFGRRCANCPEAKINPIGNWKPPRTYNGSGTGSLEALRTWRHAALHAASSSLMELKSNFDRAASRVGPPLR